MAEVSLETGTGVGTASTDAFPDHPLTDRVIDALREIYDPEIPVNIFDLGLIYGISFDAENNVQVEMTLTTPACPVAGAMPGQVRSEVLAVGGVNDCEVELVWDPPWDPSKMSEDARLALGLD